MNASRLTCRENPTQAELDINYTQYAYDSLGRFWKVTDAEGNITTTRYCPDGKVWKVIDAAGHTTITHTVGKRQGSLREIPLREIVSRRGPPTYTNPGHYLRRLY